MLFITSEGLKIATKLLLLSFISQCMDFGFHNCIARALLMHCSAEEGKQRSLQSGAEQLAACVGGLDSRADKQRFLESHHAAFMVPKKFEFQGHRGDEVSTFRELYMI